MATKTKSHCVSNVGHVRQNNEDSFLVDEKHGLYVVADGMGGHAAGEVASETAIDQISSMVHGDFDKVERFIGEPSPAYADEVRRLVESAVQAATYMVFSMAEESPEKKGMGTTISLLLLTPHHAFVAQVGDSRVYRMRGGQLVQVTEDHTVVNQAIKDGRLTKEEARNSRLGHLITRVVGTRDFVEVDTFHLEVDPRDRFLLSSDGLHDYVSDPEEISGFVAYPSLPQAADGLIDFALGAGGKDNVTVILVECGDPP